jgi:hypothetical protein
MKKENSLVVLDKITTREEYQILLDSGAIPDNLNTPEKLMTVIRLGQEMGLTPMIAVNNIHIIKGRTVIASAMLGAILKRNNIEYEYTKDFKKEEDGRILTEIAFTYLSKVTKQPKTVYHEVSWGQMELAGYTTKDNWKKYPKEMLRARAMSYGVRALFPEILLGIYTDIDMADSSSDEEYVTEMTEDGNFIVIENEENN